MRTIKNLPIPQDGNDNLFPDGQIRNETISSKGTPVVREVYGDILTNAYKIVKDAGIQINEQEDSEANGYQILQALKRFSNELNDIIQLVTVSGQDLSVNINLDTLPTNYIFTGRVSENLNRSTNYTLTGSGNNTFNAALNSDVNASSEVLIILNKFSSEAKFISLSKEESQNTISTPYNGVLSYNSENKTYYLSDGFILANTPESHNVQQAIRVDEVDNDILVYDAVIHKSVLICLAKNQNETVYDLYLFNVTNFNSVVNKITLTQQEVTDHEPYLYADKNFIYLTNLGNNSTDDFRLRSYSLDANTFELTASSDIELNANFDKTTNAFIKDSKIYTFVNGDLFSYPFAGQTRNFENFLNNTNGQVFNQNSKIYFKSGDSSNLWSV